ncbi:hypothetical protein [Alteromonas portus]|uniref:hypothetical protein n=1 Tax=Alteromonas portus TaxID=2565549 RepID=UPI003BF8D895
MLGNAESVPYQILRMKPGSLPDLPEGKLKMAVLFVVSPRFRTTMPAVTRRNSEHFNSR